MDLPNSIAAGLIALLLVGACGESSGISADSGPPTVTLGTGSSVFEPLTEGGTILIVQGPQGGYHFFGSLQATNLDGGNASDLSDPTNPQTTFGAFVEDVQVDLGAASYKQGLRLGPSGLEMIGRTVILDIEDDSELAGVEVEFRVSVVDSKGVMVSDQRRLVAQPDPNNQ